MNTTLRPARDCEHKYVFSVKAPKATSTAERSTDAHRRRTNTVALEKSTRLIGVSNERSERCKSVNPLTHMNWNNEGDEPVWVRERSGASEAYYNMDREYDSFSLLSSLSLVSVRNVNVVYTLTRRGR